MKLASLRDGSRDGLLAVVSRDLSLAHVATGRARSMRQLLDDWNFLSPQLETLSTALNAGQARHAFSFDPRQCLAPLPRTCCWAQAADGTAGLPGDPPPRLRFGAGHGFAGPTDRLSLPQRAGAVLQAHAGLVVITGDLPAGAQHATALDGVRLLLLALHGQLAADMATGSAWQYTAFAPLAVTPDELGPAWQQGRVHAGLHLQAAGQAPSQQHLAAEAARQWQAAGFAPLLARLAADGPVPAGGLLGSGPLGAGIGGLRAGDTLSLSCTAEDGGAIFGTVQQTLVPGSDSDDSDGMAGKTDEDAGH